MRNKIQYKTILLSLIMLIGLSELCFSDEFTFRKTSWGMSKKEVKTSEANRIIEENEEFLAYESNLLNKDVMVSYFFIDNKLIQAMYSLNESHTNDNDYIQDYYGFKKCLEKKYGKSKTDDKIWKNDLYTDDCNRWGMAVSIGHLVFQSSWETPLTEIYLVLRGDNYKISCGIVYNSKEFKELREKKEMEETLESF